MKFFKRKGFLSVFIAIFAAFGVGILLNITHKTQSISENEVRSQLEQMYDAEVAGVTMKQDVYKAVITKSGTFYLVEMNAVTGDVYSLEQTDEFDLDKQIVVSEDSAKDVKGNTLEIQEQPLLQSSDETNFTAKVEIVKPPTKIVITEKPKNANTKSATTQSRKSTVAISPKGLKSTQTKVEEKLPEEKQIKEEKTIKEVIKDVLKSESSKTEEAKVEKDKDKEDVSKVEQTKTEVAKTEIVKEESPLSETSKLEDTKAEEQQTTPIKPLAIQSDAKKPDADSKTDKAPTVLISEEQAIKTAQQQIKGTVESNSFVKTNEGGYYLIVMKASLSDTDSKEGSKTKQSKATIQVHAISGKILSVTWE
ncbi:PepSY domain-containing protein [Psychrobacillus sp. L3]|uniref:PepSY domain-containing protein n=1 Tax=Psychrobacillus sp. L3 TaxID=3236891 RepID=UPI0036F41CB3